LIFGERIRRIAGYVRVINNFWKALRQSEALKHVFLMLCEVKERIVVLTPSEQIEKALTDDEKVNQGLGAGAEQSEKDLANAENVTGELELDAEVTLIKALENAKAIEEEELNKELTFTRERGTCLAHQGK
jgi:DNA anti-recombination protein RmuC